MRCSRAASISHLSGIVCRYFSSLCDLSSPCPSLPDIIECLPGAEIKSESSDQSLLLTIVTKTDQRGLSRILGLKFASRDVRNSILSGLRFVRPQIHLCDNNDRLCRSLMADLQVNSSGAAKSQAGRVAGAAPSSSTSSAGRRPSVTATAPGEVATSVNPMGSRPVRRLSVREIAQEEKLAAKPQQRKSVSQAQVDADVLEESQRVAAAMKRQLADEKEKHERMTIQVRVCEN